MRRTAWWVIAVWCVGCSAGERPASGSSPPLPSSEPGIPAAAERRQARVARAEASETRAPNVSTRHAPPPRACVLAWDAPRRIWGEPAAPAITTAGVGFVVGAIVRGESGETRLAAVRVEADGTTRALGTTAAVMGLRATTRPALTSLAAARFGFAYTGTDGSVRTGAGSAEHETSLEPFTAIEHADTRMAPAIADLGDRVAIAAVKAGDAMRTEVVWLAADRRVVRREQASAPAMGSAAPTFVAREDGRHTLLVIDAHAGYSPLVTFDLPSDGPLGEARIGRPVSQPASPPMLAAAQIGDVLFVGFTAVGMAATSAVGLVRFDDTAAPRPIVRGTAYGALSVNADVFGEAAVFAADAPKEAGARDGPREVHVRVVDRDGMGDALVIRGPEGTARDGAIAAFSNGVAAVAFASPSGVYVALIRCAGSDR